MKPKILFLVSLSCLTLVSPGYAKRRRTPVKPGAKQEQPASAQPAAPPPTLAEMPASAPQVAFHSGELTISAQNSTLGDILKEVRAQTGATVELPGNAPERVVGRFGPGPARDVLTSLLNGSHFNYLLLGSAADPNALDRVILMAKSSASTETSPPPMEQANTYNQPVYNRAVATPMAAPGNTTMVVEGQDGQDDNTADDSADTTDEAQTDDQTDDSATDDQTADDQTTGDQQVGEDAQQQVQGQQGVKTPEQLLQELQQQQQQLQQQQQQNGQPGFPPGFPRPGMPGQPGMPGPPHN